MKRFFIFAMAVALPSLAQTAGLKGFVIDAATGNPVPGAAVMLNDQGIVVTTGASGEFTIDNAVAGKDVIIIAAYGYNDFTQPVDLTAGSKTDLGSLRLGTPAVNNSDFYEAQQELVF